VVIVVECVSDAVAVVGRMVMMMVVVECVSDAVARVGSGRVRRRVSSL
jgi:hypothetical protein